MQERRKKPWTGPRDRRLEKSTKCLSDLQLEESADRFTRMCRYLVNKFEGKPISVLFSRETQTNFDHGKLSRLENYLKRIGLNIDSFEIAVGEELIKDLANKQFHLVFIEDNLDMIKVIKQSEKSKRAVIVSVSERGGVQTRAGSDYSISYLPI